MTPMPIAAQDDLFAPRHTLIVGDAGSHAVGFCSPAVRERDAAIGTWRPDKPGR